MTAAAPSDATASGLHPISVETFLLTYLYTMDKPASAKEISSWIDNYIDRDVTEKKIESWTKQGLVISQNRKYELGPKGKSAAESVAAGRFDKKKRDTTILPALALGLPLNSNGAGRLTKTENLHAVALVRLCNLPLDPNTATRNQAVSALLTEALSGKGGRRIGSYPLDLFAGGLGDISAADTLRRTLVKAALKLPSAIPGIETIHESNREEKSRRDLSEKGDLAAFAERVQQVTDRLTTPPLSDAVAIAQVYDEYGREHTDAGSFETFKSRLLDAQGKRLLGMRTLDRPETIDRDLRKRSEIKSEFRTFHLIARKGAV